MSRRGIANLHLPANQDRVDLLSPDFEHIDAPWNEDILRVDGARETARELRGEARTNLLTFANLIDPNLAPATPHSLGSARSMRRNRILVTGGLLKLVGEDTTGQVKRFDVIKPGWSYNRKGLREERAERLKEEFRADLNRAARKLKKGPPSGFSGFLFAALHGDFETEEALFQIHFHMVVTGDWIDVVNLLRKQRAYKPTKRVKRPVRARHKLTDLPYALSYILKSYWPRKWKGKVSGKGTERRSRGHGRIPEPYHSDVLLWLHGHQLSDLILMMGCEIGKDGLRLTKKTVRQSNI